jgi:hypothetical protein
VITLGLLCVSIGGLMLAWAAFGFLRQEPTVYQRRMERVKTIAGGALIAAGAMLQLVGRL